MLLNEWNWDDAIAVNRQEAWEDGIEVGWGKGREEIARNALAEGLSLEMIQKITALDLATIERLQPDA